MSEISGAAQGSLSPEDDKLAALARAGRLRMGSPQGAAVRDLTGRTYVAVTIDLPSLQLDASHRRSRGSRQATR